ncbi:MAG TPA: FGGY-family carbohydrate kinase [Rectinemataceae bacterium]|nr:FGGY-family carbohydrate kinase [Rectinemataceae bacterium]
MGGVRVAVDVGAGSVKMLAARFDDGRIVPLRTFEFPDKPLRTRESLRIDLPGILEGIKKGIAGLTAETGACESLGIDTYGNGYGVLDREGKLIGVPYHYRDGRTEGILERMADRIPPEELFRETGIYPVRSRVLMQLYSEVVESSRAMREGATFLPLANLLTYFLTGEKAAERTIASVCGLLEVGGEGWNEAVMERLSIPDRIFPRIVDGGSVAGKLADEGILGTGRGQTTVVNVFAHDTESALLATSLPDRDALFASLGTSIIFGARTKTPVVNREGYVYHFKNMTGAFGTNSLCKDFPGFWIANRCLESWNREGAGLGRGDLNRLAGDGKGNIAFLDVSDPIFRSDEADMVQTILGYCERTGQPRLGSKSEIVRCLFESIALQIKWSLECLRKVSGVSGQTRIAVMNGGTRNPLLLQMIADATGLDVLAGSPIASAMGNLLAQLYGAGELATPAEIQEAVSASCELRLYACRRDGRWDEALGRMKRIGLFAE